MSDQILAVDENTFDFISWVKLPPPKWNSVEEQLPPCLEGKNYSADVLCFVPASKETKAYKVVRFYSEGDWYDEKGRSTQDINYEPEKITFWHPLPDDPEKG